MYVNLLPPAMRLRGLLRRRLRQWSLVVIVGALVLAPVGLWHNARLDRRAAESEALVQRCASLRELQTALIELESRRASLQPPALVTAARSRQRLPEAILAAIVDSVSAAEKVQLRQCSLQDHRIPGAPSGSSVALAANKAGTPKVNVMLVGVAEDEQAISTLMQSLRRRPALTTVELKSVSESNVAGTRCKEFQVHLEVTELGG